MKCFLLIGLLACAHPNNRTITVDNCWDDRKTVKKLSDVKGVVSKQDDWLSVTASSFKQMFPCNLPDTYKPGDSILFSANQKEIFPNERWAGTPIEITSIELIGKKSGTSQNH